MTSPIANTADRPDAKSPLSGPEIVPDFEVALTRLCAIARRGQRVDSPLYNPSEEWIVGRMPIFQDLPEQNRSELLAEADALESEATEANAAGRAATKVWPETGIPAGQRRVGVLQPVGRGAPARPDPVLRGRVHPQPGRPGFLRGKPATVHPGVQPSVRQNGGPLRERRGHSGRPTGRFAMRRERSFHARQLLFGTRYMQAPYMWRRLTFDLPQEQWQEAAGHPGGFGPALDGRSGPGRGPESPVAGRWG